MRAPRLIASNGLLWFGALCALGVAWQLRRPPAPAGAIVSPSAVTVQAPAPAAESNRPRPDRSASSPAPDFEPSVARADNPIDEIARAREWARENPAAALLWLPHAAPGEKRDAVLEIVCAEVAAFDGAQALALAERYSSGNYPLLENLVHQWAAHEGPAAAAHVLARPPGEVRSRLLGRVALARAAREPAEAARLIVEQIPPGDIQHEAVIGVLQAWVRQDPSSALAWAQLFPAGELRERALHEVSAGGSGFPPARL